MPTLRRGLRRWHGRRIRGGIHIRDAGRTFPGDAVPVESQIAPPSVEEDDHGDLRGLATRPSRGDFVATRKVGGVWRLLESLSVPVLRPVRVGTIDGMRLRCAIRRFPDGDVRVPRVRLPRPLGCGHMPRVPDRIRGRRRAVRKRVRVPSLRHACRIGRGPMFVRRLVRRLSTASISLENRRITPLSFERVDSSSTGHPVGRNPKSR